MRLVFIKKTEYLNAIEVNANKVVIPEVTSQPSLIPLTWYTNLVSERRRTSQLSKLVTTQVQKEYKVSAFPTEEYYLRVLKNQESLTNEWLVKTIPVLTDTIKYLWIWEPFSIDGKWNADDTSCYCVYGNKILWSKTYGGRCMRIVIKRGDSHPGEMPSVWQLTLIWTASHT